MDAIKHQRRKHIMDCFKDRLSISCITTNRRQLDWERSGIIEYDDDDGKICSKKPAETHPPGEAKDISSLAAFWQQFPSHLRFFLDGSRRTYKISDVPIGSRLYPFVAGQVGVGVCERIDRQMKALGEFKMSVVLAVPSGLNVSGKNRAQQLAFFSNLQKEINSKDHPSVALDEILHYTAGKQDDPESKGIEVIQDYMMAKEREVVKQLVGKGCINDEAWLVKDGSLEYARVEEYDPWQCAMAKENYRHVIGLSKSFNPELMPLKGNQSASRVLSCLKPYHRTPAFYYSSNRVDGKFAIWYLRIRQSNYMNNSPFDGVLKIEKLLVTDDEIRDEALETEEVDRISAWVLNERNPVCYGKDSRWANHIYPIYVTENFVKSKYMSTAFFTQLF